MCMPAHLFISANARKFFLFFCDISQSTQICDDEKKSDVQLDGVNTDGFDRCENVAAVGTALTFPSKKAFRWRCNSVHHRNYFGITTATFIC